MAYIDKDAIPYFIAIDKETGKKVFIATKEYVDKAPAADVVPKSEVAKEIFAEIELLIEKYAFEPNYCMQNMEEDIASLKKKYTEDHHDSD